MYDETPEQIEAKQPEKDKLLVWHCFCKNVNYDLCMKLINDGANVNATCFGKACLYYASEKGDINLVRLFVENGANLNYKTIYDRRYVTNAKTALMISCKKGYIEIVEYLVEKGAAVNLRNGKGSNRKTALMFACKHGHIEIVKILLNNCANIYSKSNKKMTASMYAKMAGHEKIVEILTGH